MIILRAGRDICNALPAPNKVKKVEHLASLPYAELPAFMVELRKRNSVSALALEFSILTCRPGRPKNEPASGGRGQTGFLKMRIVSEPVYRKSSPGHSSR